MVYSRDPACTDIRRIPGVSKLLSAELPWDGCHGHTNGLLLARDIYHVASRVQLRIGVLGWSYCIASRLPTCLHFEGEVHDYSLWSETLMCIFQMGGLCCCWRVATASKACQKASATLFKP